MSATIYLVGAGPGSADFLTVRAARLLGQADVVLYDALVCKDVLELAPHARKVLVGKRAGHVSTDQAFINRLLVRSARDGQIVVRLKGGDPMIFGRAHEEIEACHRAGLEVEIVPGITAASAAAAHLQTSLTQRGIARSISFVTPSAERGSSANTAWADVVATSQTSAMYMAASQSAFVRGTLLARGMAAQLPVVLVSNAGRPEAEHRAGCLDDLCDLSTNLSEGPTILLIGDVFAHLNFDLKNEDTWRRQIL